VNKQIGLLIISSVLMMADAFSAETILTEKEVQSLFSGNTIKGTYLDIKIPFESYFDEKGGVYQNRDGENFEGKWFVNKQGKHCIKWQGKDAKCRVVVRNNDQYLEFLINTKTGKREYLFIINKIIEGNPEGLD